MSGIALVFLNLGNGLRRVVDFTPRLQLAHLRHINCLPELGTKIRIGGVCICILRSFGSTISSLTCPLLRIWHAKFHVAWGRNTEKDVRGRKGSK